VSPVDEGRLAELMAPRRARWAARAADESLREPQRVYAAHRARSMGRTHARRLARCATAGVVVKCACPGKRDVRWYGCRSHLTCERCQRQRSKRMGARVRAALEARFAEHPGHRLVLITLTVRHTGDLARDRRELASGWRGLYKRLHRRGWGDFPYVGVIEITPGTDGLGHVHAHIAAVWPWRDWGVVRELWLDACPASERINFVASYGVRAAAKYVSKYLSKGIQRSEFTPLLRAEVLSALYQARQVFTSVGVWVPFHPVCRCCGTRVHRAQFGWSARPLDISIVYGWLDPPYRGSAQASFELSTAYERASSHRA
jgi:hypothetical protein